MATYVTVEVDADEVLEQLDDQELIDEIESRGWTVVEDDAPEELFELTRGDLELLMSLLVDARIGSREYFLREALYKIALKK